jgi:hypothetical protein
VGGTVSDGCVSDAIDVHAYPGPLPSDWRWYPPKTWRAELHWGRDPMRASVLGEFGGLAHAVEGHTCCRKGWGYKWAKTCRQLARQTAASWRAALRPNLNLSGAVYTQLSDVEQSDEWDPNPQLSDVEQSDEWDPNPQLSDVEQSDEWDPNPQLSDVEQSDEWDPNLSNSSSAERL